MKHEKMSLVGLNKMKPIDERNKIYSSVRGERVCDWKVEKGLGVCGPR